MTEDAINIIQAPKYKLKEIPIDHLIRSISKLQGQNLKAFYKKICGDDEILALKNNTDMLRRKLLYTLQKDRHGGLSTKHYNVVCRLSSAETPTKIKDKIEAKSGTTLKRLWNNEEHHVYVHEKDFEYKGVRYKSLSKIAKLITGHERSGPAFFGLKKAKAA